MPAGDSIVLGLRHGSATMFVARGGLTADAVTYTASLSKQVTAACAALLVRRGRLDVESTVADWLPELPAWARTVRLVLGGARTQPARRRPAAGPAPRAAVPGRWRALGDGG